VGIRCATGSGDDMVRAVAWKVLLTVEPRTQVTCVSTTSDSPTIVATNMDIEQRIALIKVAHDAGWRS
jgi:hypothetical protein